MKLHISVLLFFLFPLITFGLPNCDFKKTNERDLCFDKINTPDGGRYIGAFKKNKYHGLGTYIFPSGDKFIGYFKENKRHGAGVLWVSEKGWLGDFSAGYYINDRLDGIAIYTTPKNNAAYLGKFDNGVFKKWYQIKSPGTLFPKLRNKFYTFDSDQRKGLQKFLELEGLYPSTIDGKWGRNTLNAFAAFSVINYNTIDLEKIDIIAKVVDEIGKLSVALEIRSKLPRCKKNNFNNCFGSITEPDGNKYEGEFNNGFFNGKGKFTFFDGSIYIGDFKNGKQNGNGVFTFGPDTKYYGDRMEGKFVNNIFEGYGKYYFANGDIYEGEWKDNRPYGKGTLSFSNGNKYIGEFKNKFNGLGTFIFSNGDKYIGEWVNGKKNGKGKFISSNGNQYEGEWKDDIFISKDYADTKETHNVASGTGFYVSTRGHIVTNNHVVDGCTEVKAHALGKSQIADIIAKDKLNDLALLKVQGNPPYVFPIELKNPYPLQEIIVAGFPFGELVSSSIKFTKGIVSSIAGIGDNYSQIQIDAAIQPGNSGGPIVDENGNVIAVAVAKLDQQKILENFGVIPEDTNFGIKANAVRNLLEGNNIISKEPSSKIISKNLLSKNIANGTVFLSCWMKMVDIKNVKNKKVLFKEFE